MKTLFQQWSLLILICLVFPFCNKDEKVVPVLEVDKPSIEATAEAGTASLDITSNVDWDFSGIPSWLTIEPSSGRGNATVEFSYPANAKAEQLTVTLILNAKGLSSSRVVFNQLGAAPSMLINKTEIEEKPEGQQDSVTITSNVPWKIVMPVDSWWITPGASTGKAGVTKLFFTIAPNNRIGAREAVIKLESTGPAVTPLLLKITQEQPEIVINSFTPNAKGGATIKIRGSGFSSMLSENSVSINGQDAVVTKAVPDELDVTVPVAAGTGKIAVTVGTKTGVSSTDFVYDLVWRVYTVPVIASENDLAAPAAVVIGNDGFLYVADKTDQQIKKISSTGAVTVLAGTGSQGFQDGPGNIAMFSDPTAMAIDGNNNLYVSDRNNKRIRKIEPNGNVSTLAGDGTTAIFNNPQGVTVDANGNVYVADYGNHRIRKITPAGVVTTIAGSGTAGSSDGTGVAASFNNPAAIEVTTDGMIYVAEPTARRIRKIDNTGKVTTLVNGLTNDPFTNPSDIASDAAGNIYVADQLRHSVYSLSPAGVATVIAGMVLPGHKDGEGVQAKFNLPVAIALGINGEFLVADQGNKMIRKLFKQ
ncbi:BACON domain-containing protein [Pseudobacter ginsenosidimutans]|uniref:All-beta uncharacterized protein n=1 Tax=Pseudobacter ginsenosidimutans TaxID=661488 RepID=A0A4Q7MM09_9BACT|nr:BACON domain-containing carbohydrate-binding protein [Pseudobacter ginsenosidimutans]QEC45706.1 hypothetical protein FSB84_29935 [Pseudobacter ginsenosidimutans]RZS69356.1 all-beta uncharacterized protein [Pseudobacter ginsenosidimutans]